MSPEPSTGSTMASANKHLSTPKPRMAFRVGVVGHRPNRLEHADMNRLGDVIHALLDTVKQDVCAAQASLAELFAGGEPVLRAISPLAEGTDRLFAEQAMKLGYELCCVMPFAQAEFEKDFAPGVAMEPDSTQRFRRLLERAKDRGHSAVFELDGSRANEAAAYGAAGQVVLNQSDRLLVVWDGQRLGKRGGTEETLDAARRVGVPVVWIDAHAPHHWQILDAQQGMPQPDPTGRVVPVGSEGTDPIARRVRGVLDLPTSEKRNLDEIHQSSTEARQNLLRFFAERQIGWTSALIWKCFQNVVGDSKVSMVSPRIKPYEDAVVGEWPRDCSTPLAGMVDTIRPYYAWPDKLSGIYGDRYRSAFITAFLLASMAVGLALLPHGFGFPEHGLAEILCTAAELAAIVMILSLIFLGRRGRWHERWIEYRLVAELVRHVRVVASLGGGRPFPQAPAHLATYGHPSGTWMDWYTRAVARDIGLPSAKVAGEHMLKCMDDLTSQLLVQRQYHSRSTKRCHAIEHRLHFIGIALLMLTLLSCGLHLLSGLWHIFPLSPWLPGHLLVFFCGFFPALGAALAGINNQGEFRRIAKRSNAMVEHLEPLLNRAKALQDRVHASVTQPPQTFWPEAVLLSSEMARLLVSEVLDWRVVFLDRPLDPPA